MNAQLITLTAGALLAVAGCDEWKPSIVRNPAPEKALAWQNKKMLGHELVWLMNNRGVTNWALEEQVLDPKAASTVKITNRLTGEVCEKTIPPGGYDWVVFD